MKHLGWLAILFIALTGCATRDVGASTTLTPVELPQQKSSALFGEVINAVNPVLGEKDKEALAELEEWQRINSDVCALIDIEDLEVHDPVVAATVDNNQWLRTNIEGVPDIAGCVFLDYRSDLSSTPVKLIHGHNMKDGSMFGNLPTLLELESCEDAPTIKLFTEDGWLSYEVFAVLSVNSKEEALPIDFLSSYDDIEKMTTDLLGRSVVPDGEVQSGDLLVLNTCWYGESGVERNLHCIVCATRVV